jgi:regulator of ribonuclease activity B
MKKSSHCERNIATLHALQNAGANPNKLHSIEHHLYCYSEASFNLVMSLGRQRGFEVAHAGKREEEEALWSLDLTVRSLPTMEAVEWQSIEIEEIAEAAEADYDGWGTEVER